MTGNRFFTPEEIALHREVEGDWDRQHPDEPPRLNDPPRPRRPGQRMTWDELVDMLEAKREKRMLEALAAAGMEEGG